MRHLTPADYRQMPWVNGRGTTVEMLREDGPDGLRLRLSMASVVEDGPFSVLPGIERNLTVISGPGFRLEGEVSLDCRPLVPVAFPGDMAVRATGTKSVASEDFNVMTARARPHPEVRVLNGQSLLAEGGRLLLLTLADSTVNGRAMGPKDLAILDGAAEIRGSGPAIAVRLFA